MEIADCDFALNIHSPSPQSLQNHNFTVVVNSVMLQIYSFVFSKVAGISIPDGRMYASTEKLDDTSRDWPLVVVSSSSNRPFFLFGDLKSRQELMGWSAV